MLPKILYELLPFIYLAVGLTGSVMRGSALIFVGSVLLVTTGVIILIMRFNHRREIRRNRYLHTH